MKNDPNRSSDRSEQHDDPQRLLAAAQGGDTQGLTRLVVLAYAGANNTATDCLMQLVRSYLVQATLRHRRSLGANPDSMAQHGVLKMLAGLPELEERTASCFLAYLDHMARNWCIDEERKRHRHKETTLGGDSDGHRKPTIASPSKPSAVVSAERLEFLLSCCSNESDRCLLRWRFGEDRSYSEIGSMFDPPRREDTVRMQISRLLVRLGEDSRVRREWGK